MSGKGPGIFSDIGKKARDILTKDYNSNQRLIISPIELDATLLKSRLSYGDVSAAVKYKNTSFLEVFTVFRITGAVPFSRNVVSIQLPDYYFGKIEVQYLLDHAGFTAAVDIDLNRNRNPVIDFSATIGTPNIAFGAEIGYSTRFDELTKYNVGVCSNGLFSNVSVIFADKGDSMKMSYLHEVEKLNGGAVVGEISRKFSTDENTLTVGCSYVVDPQTVVKAKLNNHGNLGALLCHELTQKSLFTISGAIEIKDLYRIPKFGLSLLLKP